MGIDFDSIKRLTVRVLPGSSRNEIRDVDAETGVIKIAIKAQPQDGKANLELVKFLRKLSKKKVRILSGATSKNKIVIFE